jgi:UDP-N-acetylmuramoyl-L-alanyl-D-glutamate--2,6-diaminopimelate ligase
MKIFNYLNIDIQLKYMKKIIPQKIKNIYHLIQAILANFYFGFPSKKLKVIGITGTNGKTTTVQMIIKILEEAGHKIAMASTINFKIGDKEWVNKTKFTTLSAWEVQKFIKKAVKENCEYLVLETSSHSLDQYRVWGVDYDIAVVTNVTREHLDYHKTMDGYRKAKLKLFKNVDNIVVNLDMSNPEEFLAVKANNKCAYASDIENKKIETTDNSIKVIKAEGIGLEMSGSRYKIDGVDYKLNLPGLFNIENALAATCVGLTEKIDQRIIAKALGELKGISGRMEYVENDKGLNIIVDYAVTPDSLEKLYKLIEDINRNNGNIISVFGSCGDRDRGKRPIMGEIVSRAADYVLVTNEDPYNEDPKRIIDEVAAGIKNKKEGKDFWKIFDRREAINKALNIAKPGDFVVVTGKGAEETMAIGAERIEWNDKKVILEELKK